MGGGLPASAHRCTPLFGGLPTDGIGRPVLAGVGGHHTRERDQHERDPCEETCDGREQPSTTGQVILLKRQESDANEKATTREQQRKAGGTSDDTSSIGVAVDLVLIDDEAHLLNLLFEEDAHLRATASSLDAAPRRASQVARSRREWIPSLRRIDCAWLRIVCHDTDSSMAISL